MSVALRLLVVPLGLLLAACGSPDSGGGSIAVSAGDRTCEVARTTLSDGKVVFDVTNTGKDVTEVYVYAKGGSGAFDKVVGEVENIAPGTSRDFPVTFGGGEFELACKPGQTGDGLRTRLTVSGPGETTVAHDREVAVTARDDGFTGLQGFTAKVGEKVELALENAGSTQHELEVFSPDGSALGEVGPTAPGADGEVVLEFRVAGTYRYDSGIADDAARGLKGTFTVS